MYSRIPGLRRLFVIVAIFACVFSLQAQHSSAPPPKLAPGNFEILGIRLGGSTVDELKRVLGAAQAVTAKDTENSVMCYASTSDRTILEFENWTDPIEFRLFMGSDALMARCLRTDKVSASISTVSGLHIGMNRADAIALLGEPTKVVGTHLIYEEARVEPARGQGQTATANSANTVEVYEKIDLQLRATIVAKIDVTRSESD